MSSPNADAASRRAVTSAAASSGASCTTRMPLPPPPADGLTNTGYPTSSAPAIRSASVRPGPRNAGHHRHPERRHRSLGGDLVAHRLDRRDRRTDEHDACRLQRRGELCVLRKEPVAGVHRLGAGASRGLDDRLDVEVAQPRRRRADAHGGVGLGDVAGAGVGIAEHRHRPDTHGTQRADDPHGDLAAVGYQNGIESLGRHQPHIRNTP